MFKIKSLKPALALRIGLGVVFSYAGIMSFVAPENWVGFIPPWVGKIIDPPTFLYIHAAFELILGLAFIIGLYLPLTALLAFFNMSAILLFFGVDEVTFRDFSILMSSLALFLIVTKEG